MDGDHGFQARFDRYEARYKEAMATAFVDMTKDLSKYASPPYTRVAVFNVNEDYYSQDSEDLSISNFQPRAYIIHDENSELEQDNSKLEAAIDKCLAVAEANMLQLLPYKTKWLDPGALPYDGTLPELGPWWFSNLPPEPVIDSPGHREDVRLANAYATGTAKAPIVAVIARIAARVPQAMVNILHLQNNIVYNDWCQVQNSIPNGIYRSIVLNDIKAHRPCPMSPKDPATPPAQVRITELLEEANKSGRELILLVRGINGHSLAPVMNDGYEAIHGVDWMRSLDEYFPDLPVRIVYALRPQFLAGPHYTMPIGSFVPTVERRCPPTQPFRLSVTPSATRKLYYTRPINIRDLTDQARTSRASVCMTPHDLLGVDPPLAHNAYDNPVMAQIVIWHTEEHAIALQQVSGELQKERTYILGRLDVD